jgi:hypothetical protein
MMLKTHLKRRIGTGGLVCLVVTLACGEPPGPELDVFMACELGLIESEVQSGWTLIGLPARRVTADELSVAGLVGDLAYMLSHSDKLNWETNRWCVGREFANARPATRPEESPEAKTTCVLTELLIPGVVQTGATRVRLTVQRSPSGRAVLRKFEPR